MAKKRSWKEKTGLKIGDTAYCKGTINYKNKRIELINEEVIIKEIKSNVCTCLVKKIEDEENVEVSILKKFISNKKFEEVSNKTIVYNKVDDNKSETIAENMSDDATKIFNKIAMGDTHEIFSTEDMQSKIIEATQQMIENDNEIDTNIVKEHLTEQVKENTNDDKQETQDDKQETQIIETEKEENIEETAVEESEDIKIDEEKIENKNEIQIPNMGFKNHPISRELETLILNAANLDNKTILTLNDGIHFNEKNIDTLKEMYLHVPVNNNLIHPIMCYRLLCNIDYKDVVEFKKYENNFFEDIELELFINQASYTLEKYTFKTIDRYGIKRVIHPKLSILQDKMIEKYGESCVKYYEELMRGKKHE